MGEHRLPQCTALLLSMEGRTEGEQRGGRLSPVLARGTRRGVEGEGGKGRLKTAWTNLEQPPEFRASPS